MQPLAKLSQHPLRRVYVPSCQYKTILHKSMLIVLIAAVSNINGINFNFSVESVQLMQVHLLFFLLFLILLRRACHVIAVIVLNSSLIMRC